jgi:sec-independent protein translocase protein TatA
MPNIGPGELLIILVIALVIFGPKRLPGLGRSLGSGMRQFRQAISGQDDAPAPAAGPADGAEAEVEPASEAEPVAQR